MSRHMIISLVIIELALMGAVFTGIGLVFATGPATALSCIGLLVFFLIAIIGGVRQILRGEDGRAEL